MRQPLEIGGKMNISEQLTNLILDEKKNKLVLPVEENTGCHCSRIDDELNNGVIKDGVKIMIDEENSEIIHFDEVTCYLIDPFITDKKLDAMSSIIQKIFKERKKSENIKEIVVSINNTEVSKIDFLSNNIYQYDRKSKKMNIVD